MTRHPQRLALTLALSLLLAAGLTAGCGKEDRVTKGSSGGSLDITGAGATFPYPLYSKWVHAYHEANPEVRISYQSIGSGGGIRQITARTVDFGASDAPVSDEELARADGELVHIPMTIGAVAVAFNLDGVKQLNLTPDVLADIYLGEIDRWNHERIAEVNPDIELPDEEIVVTYRSDGSGTTAVFTDYLSAVSPAWKEKVGAGKSVRFPTGLGAKGNEGVAGQIRNTEGAIGYIELAYAIQTKIAYAALQNQAGDFVEPSLEGITAAAAGSLGQIPDDYRISIVNAEGEKAYPISAFTYILVYRDMKNEAKAKALAEFLWWAIHEGQEMAPPLHYAELPASLVERIEKTLESLRAGGKPLLAG